MSEQRFNQLTPAEDERLTVLAEECAETIVAICKIKRHGFRSHHSSAPSGFDNRFDLERELGDLFHAVRRLEEAGDVNPQSIRHYEQQKAQSIGQYLHHQQSGREDSE